MFHSSRQPRWRLTLTVAASIISLALAETCRGENKPAAKQGKPAANAKPANQGKPDPNAGVKLSEAEHLTKIYALLAGANHDYDGHRGKAMHAVSGAIKLLDNAVLSKGTAGQKVAAAQDKSQVAQINAVQKHTPALHELQAASDAQLRQAAQLLDQVRPMLAKRNQPKILGHVNTAIAEIGIALKIR